jgi:sulfite exporter TauE/SafE/plastocyanin domain-containing protein/copper chaperone CopZ
MTCVNCQNRIENKLRNTAGVESAEVSYNDGAASVAYDADIITLGEIEALIEGLGYEALGDRRAAAAGNQAAGVLIIIFAAFMLLNQLGFSGIFNIFPTAGANTSYGMLFVIGLLTSVHCVAMCGGINLSQCVPRTADRNGTLRPSLLYNLGRVISYTAVGGIVGALGSAVSLTGMFRGAVQLIAGAFMVVMGLNMLNLFPGLRRFMPRAPKAFARKIDGEKGRSKSPLIVGLLNGLMPCGPLQAMQIFALSTGNPAAGALSMFLFSLGTAPLMFGLGALSSVLSKRFAGKVTTVGAGLVVLLGLSMFTQGWNLSGFSFGSGFGSGGSGVANASEILVEDGYQIVNSTLQPGRYPAITVQADTPVRWTVNAPQGSINGCNNRIFIPEYDIEHQFTYGENIIEFTPDSAGRFPYSCWMGMIRGSITVTEEGAADGLADGTAEGRDSAGDSYGDSGDYGNPGDPAAPGGREPEAPFGFGGDSLSESAPVPANVDIPTDTLAVAEFGTVDPGDGTEYDIQRVTIHLTDGGYEPAVVVVQAGIDVEWTIDNTSAYNNNFTLLAPSYRTRIDLDEGANPIYLFPTEDFAFSNGDSLYYGYVKVVADLEAADAEAIRAEVADYETLRYPPEFFESGGSRGCH